MPPIYRIVTKQQKLVRPPHKYVNVTLTIICRNQINTMFKLIDYDYGVHADSLSQNWWDPFLLHWLDRSTHYIYKPVHEVGETRGHNFCESWQGSESVTRIMVAIFSLHDGHNRRYSYR